MPEVRRNHAITFVLIDLYHLCWAAGLGEGDREAPCGPHAGRELLLVHARIDSAWLVLLVPGLGVGGGHINAHTGSAGWFQLDNNGVHSEVLERHLIRLQRTVTQAVHHPALYSVHDLRPVLVGSGCRRVSCLGGQSGGAPAPYVGPLTEPLEGPLELALLVLVAEAPRLPLQSLW